MEQMESQERHVKTDKSAHYALGISLGLLVLLFSIELTRSPATTTSDTGANSTWGKPVEQRSPVDSAIKPDSTTTAASSDKYSRLTVANQSESAPGQELLTTSNGITLARAYRKTGIFWGYEVLVAPENNQALVGQVILQINGKAVYESEDGAALLVIGLNNPESTLISVPAFSEIGPR